MVTCVISIIKWMKISAPVPAYLGNLFHCGIWPLEHSNSDGAVIPSLNPSSAHWNVALVDGVTWGPAGVNSQLWVVPEQFPVLPRKRCPILWSFHKKADVLGQSSVRGEGTANQSEILGAFGVWRWHSVSSVQCISKCRGWEPPVAPVVTSAIPPTSVQKPQTQQVHWIEQWE